MAPRLVNVVKREAHTAIYKNSKVNLDHKYRLKDNVRYLTGSLVGPIVPHSEHTKQGVPRSDAET